MALDGKGKKLWKRVWWGSVRGRLIAIGVRRPRVKTAMANVDLAGFRLRYEYHMHREDKAMYLYQPCLDCTVLVLNTNQA